jgi:hypothetical protein
VATGAGTVETGLQVVAGASNITAPVQGSTIPVVVTTQNSVVVQTQANNTQVTAGPQTAETVALSVNAGKLTYQSTGAAAGTSSLTIYSGETVNVAQSSGEFQNLRLGSFNQNQGLPGDFIQAPPQAGSGLQIPIIAGEAPRFREDLTARFGQALMTQFGLSPASGGASFVAQNPQSGITTVATTSGFFRLLPVGNILIAGKRPRAVSTAEIAANLTAVIGASLSFAIAPATAYEDLAEVLKQIDGDATLEILGDGVIHAQINGTGYVTIPDFAVTPGGEKSPALETADNQIILQDKDGNRQRLYPAFADTEKLRTTFSSEFPRLTLSYAGAGEYQVTLQTDEPPITVVPEISLSTPSFSQSGKSWWEDGGKFYIRYSSRSAQGFEIR